MRRGPRTARTSALGAGALPRAPCCPGRFGRYGCLAARAEIRGSRQLAALRTFLDERAAAMARPAGAVVHPQPGWRKPLPGLRVDRGGPAGGRIRSGVRLQQLARLREHALQRRLVERADRRERVDLLDEQDLALEHIADTGDGALVEDRLADGHLGARRVA